MQHLLVVIYLLEIEVDLLDSYWLLYCDCGIMTWASSVVYCRTCRLIEFCASWVWGGLVGMKEVFNF